MVSIGFASAPAAYYSMWASSPLPGLENPVDCTPTGTQWNSQRDKHAFHRVGEAPHVGGCHEGPSWGASNLPSTAIPGPPFEYHLHAGTKAYLLVPFAGVFLAPLFHVVALAEIISCLDLLLLTRNNKRTFKITMNDVEIGIWCNSPKSTFLFRSKAKWWSD